MQVSVANRRYLRFKLQNATPKGGTGIRLRAIGVDPGKSIGDSNLYMAETFRCIKDLFCEYGFLIGIQCDRVRVVSIIS